MTQINEKIIKKTNDKIIIKNKNLSTNPKGRPRNTIYNVMFITQNFISLKIIRCIYNHIHKKENSLEN